MGAARMITPGDTQIRLAVSSANRQVCQARLESKGDLLEKELSREHLMTLAD